MLNRTTIQVLAAAPASVETDYHQNLSTDSQLHVTVVTSVTAAQNILATSQRRIDVFVIDNALGDAFSLTKELRRTYPRLLIILVDRDADFGMPGHADDVSVDPFKEGDLIRRIKRLNEERSLQTLRADTLPPVRQFAKTLHRAGPEVSKSQVAVQAIAELGYDYVAFYEVVPKTPPELALSAQTGQEAITSIAPQQQDYATSLIGWVAQNGQSRVVSADDHPNHPFTTQKHFCSAVCVPVGTTLRIGVILACRKETNTISQQNVMMLELVSAQLASALAKEIQP